MRARGELVHDQPPSVFTGWKHKELCGDQTHHAQLPGDGRSDCLSLVGHRRFNLGRDGCDIQDASMMDIGLHRKTARLATGCPGANHRDFGGKSDPLLEHGSGGSKPHPGILGVIPGS